MVVHISNTLHPTKFDFDKLNPSRLMGKTVNQLDDPCPRAISFNLIYT